MPLVLSGWCLTLQHGGALANASVRDAVHWVKEFTVNVSLVETADTMIKKIKRDNAEPFDNAEQRRAHNVAAWALDSIDTLPDGMELWDYLTEHGRPTGRLERESGAAPRPRQLVVPVCVDSQFRDGLVAISVWPAKRRVSALRRLVWSLAMLLIVAAVQVSCPGSRFQNSKFVFEFGSEFQSFRVPECLNSDHRVVMSRSVQPQQICCWWAQGWMPSAGSPSQPSN